MGFVVVTPSMAAPLDGEKRWAYLAREKMIRIATTNDDGTMDVSSSWYVVRDRTIYVPVDPGTDGVSFTEKKPIAALVDSGDEYVSVARVRIRGTAKPVEDPKLFDELEELVFEKYFHAGHPYAEPYFQLGLGAGRKYWALVPETIVGWDFRETAAPQAVESHLLPKSATDRRIKR
jgi:hypothetical protein